MPLMAPRFKNHPILEACLDGTHRMLAPETGEAVQLVQDALVDLGFDLPHGGDGIFGNETGAAVSAYKRLNGLVPDDPVVGRGTMAALDRDCADKPLLPFNDGLEWRSWTRRAAQSFGHFNFTRADELARRAAGTNFTFDANSRWLPAFLQATITLGLSELLEPMGSPLGPGTPAASWGAGPFDLYHCHLSVFDAVTIPFVPPGPLEQARLKFAQRLGALEAAAANAPGAVPHNAAWCAEFARLLIEDDIATAAGSLALDAVSQVHLPQTLILIWHTFEGPPWRPRSVQTTSLERSWHIVLSPFLGSMAPFPFVTPAELRRVTVDVFEICFLVSKTGVISAMPGGGKEVMSLAGLVYGDVIKVTNP